MIFEFGTMEITPTFQEILDNIDTVGTGMEKRVMKQVDILFPDKPSVKYITNCLGFGMDYGQSGKDFSISFMDLCFLFWKAFFYANYNQEL